MLRNYFKIALRNLSRNKIYSAINIAGVSLGLACAMLIILYTKDELSYDRFHVHAQNIYHITCERVNPDGTVQFKGGITGYFQGPRFTANIPEIKSYVRMQQAQRDFKLGNEVVSRELFEVDTSFFSIFSFPLVAGNAETALDDPHAIVISEKVAKEYFGNKEALGKIIEVKKDTAFEPFIVTGVAKQAPQNSSVKFDVLMPLVVSKANQSNNGNWLNFHLNTFVQLRENADVAAVTRKMNAVFNREASPTIREMAEKFSDTASTTHGLQALTQMHLDTEYQADNGLKDKSNPIYSYILSGIALFILVIACINFINLTIARSLKRAKEIGIRKVVGGARKQLIIQFLGESFILCGCAFLLSILLVQLALPAFNDLSNKELALSYLFDTKLVAGYVLLFLITGLLSGFYPALVLSRFKPVKILYSRFNLPGKNYLQKSLVVLQFSLATLLIIATITIYKQFSFLTSQDLGYDDSNVVVVETPGMNYAKAKLFKETLLSNHHIAGVAMKNRGRMGTHAQINGENKIGFDYEMVDAAYLPLFNIRLAKGRNFSPEFPTDSSHAILVNEAFVRKAGWKEPIGQTVNFWYRSEKLSVIGVVKDYHFRPLNEEIGPQLFTMKPDNVFGKVFIKIRPNSESASLQHIAASFKKLFPLSPNAYKFQDLENLRSYEAEAKWKQMMLFGAILTLFISCIGLFGLSVLSAEKRTKEIGIRKVLGASVAGVVTTLSKDFLKLVTIAMLIAMPVAWYLANQWLENYPYRIAITWQLFAMAGLLVIVIAIATISFQSIKAAMASPVRSLRTE